MFCKLVLVLALASSTYQPQVAFPNRIFFTRSVIKSMVNLLRTKNTDKGFADLDIVSVTVQNPSIIYN